MLSTILQVKGAGEKYFCAVPMNSYQSIFKTDQNKTASLASKFTWIYNSAELEMMDAWL